MFKQQKTDSLLYVRLGIMNSTKTSLEKPLMPVMQ